MVFSIIKKQGKITLLAAIVNGIEIKEKIFDPYMDLYVLFGKAVDPSPHPYVVAWQKRGQQNDFFETQPFAKRKTAREEFERTVHGGDAPISFHPYQHDDQKQNVYNWENEFIVPYCKILSQRELQALMRLVAKDYGLKPPKIFFDEEGTGSNYDPGKNQFDLGHRDDIGLLHEMAHVILEQECAESQRDFVHHGPQYVWIVLDLYKAYANFSTQYLITTASRFDLLGDIKMPNVLDGKAFRTHGPQLEDI